MVIAIVLLATAVTLELIVSYRWPVRLRKLIAATAIGLLSIAALWLLALDVGLGSLAIAVIGLYSVVNLLRVIIGKAEIRYLGRSVRQTALYVGMAQVVATYYVVADSFLHIAAAVDIYALVVLQLVVAVTLSISVRRQLRTTAVDVSAADYIDEKHLPTVTVAVPVRNEAGQLEACLTSILASNYPKLEILAFDDHSHDKTPDIIKSFAHAGVRFIRTSEPIDGWLAKNRAYQSLAEAASGQYIVFCGADIRLGVRSIRQLVTLAQSRNKRMVAVLPRNTVARQLPLLQAMRYFWEMAPPRRLFNRPPVLSSCWLIDRSALQRYGGFAAVRQSMSSEAHLAQSAVNDADGYSFVRSDENLAITSEKAVGEQRSTALLRRYPQAHRRPEIVLLYGIGLAGLLLGPVGVVLYALLVGLWPATGIALLALGIDILAFARVQQPIFPHLTQRQLWLAFVPAIALDIWYLNRSMLQYEFATVNWKDRNVSQPVMRVMEAGSTATLGSERKS